MLITFFVSTTFTGKFGDFCPRIEAKCADWSGCEDLGLFGDCCPESGGIMCPNKMVEKMVGDGG